MKINVSVDFNEININLVRVCLGELIGQAIAIAKIFCLKNKIN